MFWLKRTMQPRQQSQQLTKQEDDEEEEEEQQQQATSNCVKQRLTNTPVKYTVEPRPPFQNRWSKMLTRLQNSFNWSFSVA